MDVFGGRKNLEMSNWLFHVVSQSPCTLKEDHPFAARSMKADEQEQIMVVATARPRAEAASSDPSRGGQLCKQSQPGESTKL